ncbi:MAG: hypothetical protein PQJ58_18115 [Spirochaetales bacterium]|nr:hypothetical protein [Spirochaetales bacterium]
MTGAWAVENYLNIQKDAIFRDYEALAKYVEGLKQDLVNLRVFETVETLLIPLPAAEDEEDRRFTVRFLLKDAWTFFPLLVPIFNSNDNFSLQLKLSYANFFGTLIHFSIDGDFGIGQDPIKKELGVNFWEVETSFSNFNYNGVAYSFSWIQSYDRKIKKDGTEIVEYFTFNKSDFFIAANFDLGSDYYYEAAPLFELTYNYQDKTGKGDSYIIKEPQSYGIRQKGGRDRVNWIGNFQEGYNWEAEILGRIVPDQGVKGEMILSNRWFTPLNNGLYYSNRLISVSSLRDEIYEMGEYARGVPDINMAGIQGFFINNNLTFTLFDWKDVTEVQMQPFSDLALVIPGERDFDLRKDLRMTLGLDFLIFPTKLTSVNLRLTGGVDLFGPGNFSDRYEIIMSTSLFF